MTFIGLDLHKRYLTACALDAGGGVLAEARQLPVSLDALASFLHGLRGARHGGDGSHALLAVAP